MTKEELAAATARLRGRVIELSCRHQIAHLGGALSCIEIVTVLYWRILKVSPESVSDPARDRFIFSKGHAAKTLYAALCHRGFIGEDELMTLAKPESPLSEHPILGAVQGVEATSGSLGHGLPIGVGMALAARLQGRSFRTFVLMSDGECNEGSVWEAAMMAPAHRLDNLVVIVDYNKWQATGRSEEVLALAPLAEKWRAFGWQTHEIDGHDLTAVEAALSGVPDGSGLPRAVICHTVKGKGVSFMEDDNNWHYRKPTEEEYEKALGELGLK
jgi:transketolase